MMELTVKAPEGHRTEVLYDPEYSEVVLSTRDCNGDTTGATCISARPGESAERRCPRCQRLASVTVRRGVPL